MSEQREEMCDVEVVLKEPFAERAGTIDGLRRNGLAVTDVDRDDGVVEGTIPAAGLAALRELESVAAVRIVFTYLADTEWGGPRVRAWVKLTVCCSPAASAHRPGHTALTERPKSIPHLPHRLDGGSVRHFIGHRFGTPTPSAGKNWPNEPKGPQTPFIRMKAGVVRNGRKGAWPTNLSPRPEAFWPTKGGSYVPLYPAVQDDPGGPHRRLGAAARRLCRHRRRPPRRPRPPRRTR